MVGCSQSRISYHKRFGKRQNHNGTRKYKPIPFSNFFCPKCWRSFTVAELKSEETILTKKGLVHWNCIMPEYMQQLQEVEISLSQYSTPLLFKRSLIETTKKVLYRPFNEAEHQLSVIRLVAQEVGVSIDISTLMAKQSQGLSP